MIKGTDLFVLDLENDVKLHMVFNFNENLTKLDESLQKEILNTCIKQLITSYSNRLTNKSFEFHDEDQASIVCISKNLFDTIVPKKDNPLNE